MKCLVTCPVTYFGHKYLTAPHAFSKFLPSLFAPYTFFSHQSHHHNSFPCSSFIRWMLPEASLHPLSNLHLWLSKALSPLTQNPLMVQAPYILHNFVTNGILLRKLTCLLTMPYYMPSLVNIKAGNLATPSVLGWLACAAGMS